MSAEEVHKEILALIQQHPFTGLGGRTIYEAPRALAAAIVERLEEAWDEGVMAQFSTGSDWTQTLKLNPYKP